MATHGPKPLPSTASDRNGITVSHRESIESMHHILPVPAQDEWEDVTQLFRSARDEMEVGELIHLDYFSLHSAMSAIELMDPKMDIGFGQVRNVFDVVLPAQLTDLQVINIMDQLLVCLMSWLDAHTLPQTVFSCVYAQLMSKIPRFELLSYLRVQLATIESIINLVMDEKVADDEDFMGSTYGFNLHPLFSNPPEEDGLILRKLLKQVDNRPVGKTDDNKALANAISLRIYFQVQLYRTIQCLAGFSYEHSLHDAPQLLQDLQRLADDWCACPFRRNVDEELINLVFDASINRHLMTSSPPRTAPLFNSKSAFGYLNRILTELNALLQHRKYALPVVAATAGSVSPEFERYSLLVAMHSATTFSARLNPTILTRSIMSRLMVPEYTMNLFTQEGADFRKLIGTDMGLTNELMTPDVFHSLGTTKQGIINMFRCLCRNRSRQRRQLLRVIRWWDHYAFTKTSNAELNKMSLHVNDHTNLAATPSNQGENQKPSGRTTKEQDSTQGDAVEALFAEKSPLQVVSFEIAAWLMTQHWFLGFECDLYEEYEYSAVFFYVGYVLTSMSNATMSLARKGRNGASLHPLRFAQYIMDEARLWMCRALYSALEGLSQGSIWKYSSGRPENRTDGDGMFGSEKLWYEQRFGVAMGMVNGPVYADYSSYVSFKQTQRESLLSSGRGTDLPLLLLQEAADGFLTARRTLEQSKKAAEIFTPNNVSEEIMQIARAAVENSLALSQMIRIYKKAVTDQKTENMYDVSFKFSTHRHFPVIKITPL